MQNLCTIAQLSRLLNLLLMGLQMQQWIALRQHLGLPLESRGDSKAETAASMLALSEAQIRRFIRLCAKRYDSKRMDPGAGPNSLPLVACFEMCYLQVCTSS